ncbi:EAL domain-containing protein [Marinobacter sp.]|uniref:EAL domain-containing protein n=1 Tax=Marinobacter sp. TaxID=50741 RepID=UPI0035614F89
MPTMGHKSGAKAPTTQASLVSADRGIYKQAQLYRAFSEVSQAILRMQSEKKLFPLVCTKVVEYGGVSKAQIKLAHPQSRHLKPKAQAQRSQDQPEDTKQPTCSDFSILRGGNPYAILSVYHEEEDFFDPDTCDLFDRLCRDLSFALDSFDQEQEHRKTLKTLKANEGRFRAYFEQSMFGMATIGADKHWIEVNQACCDLLGYTSEELASITGTELTHPDDRATSKIYARQLAEGSIDSYILEKRYIRKSGEVIDALTAARSVRNPDGSFAYAVILIEDITLRKMAERREQMRRQALEMVARGVALEKIMLQIIQAAEEIYPDAMCSILLLDKSGERLVTGVAPSLPDFYSQAILGVRIGEGVGSCGTAAFTGKRTIVEDIASHPYWSDYKQVALKAGLAASWSEPILAASGKVLGTFAIYRRKPGSPDDQEIALIESVAILISIVIERARTQQELHLAASIYNNSWEAVMVAAPDNTIVTVNPAFTRITGYSLEDVRGKNPSILSSARHDRSFFDRMWQKINESGSWQGEIWNRRKNGETFPQWLNINTIHGEDGEVQHYVAMGWDISHKIRSDELIWRQANYDFLTDLPNRYMFQDRLEQEIRAVQREGSRLALLFIDLDHFKDVNDTLGHPVGDQLLIEAAERLNRCVRGSDTVARMGGDEFTVILRDLAHAIDAETVAEQIISELALPYIINNETIYATASIGITFCPDDATDVDQLISNADQAMYASKSAGRNRTSYFTRALQDSAKNRLALINDMREAIQKQQFELHYQPVFELSSGKMAKAEALIRWNHPERGLISPVEFIPLAEETGLIVSIGDWVFRESSTAARRWQKQRGQGFQVAVNISPAQFQSDALRIDDWLSYMDSIGLDEQWITIEITEGLLLNASKDVKHKLLQFRDAGIQVAIDDFGVGYSALSYLRRFDIDILKIDQSFIRNMENEPNDLALSEAIVVMAHKLGLKVIAEGVETEAQRQMLLDIGCDYGQGYLFSRPLPAIEFEKFLLSSKTTNSKPAKSVLQE